MLVSGDIGVQDAIVNSIQINKYISNLKFIHFVSQFSVKQRVLRIKGNQLQIKVGMTLRRFWSYLDKQLIHMLIKIKETTYLDKQLFV
jgi:hypothetical protein